MNKTFAIAFFVLLLFFSTSFYLTISAEETPPWLQPQVVNAYLAINLAEDQKSKFRDALTSYIQGSNRAVRAAINNNKGNLEREIRRRLKKQINRWNDSARTFLTEEQYPLFEIYRDTLLTTMRDSR